MFDLPTYVFPLILGLIAAAAGWFVGGRGGVHDDAGSFPGWVLYAVAIGCVVIAFFTWWLSGKV
jgi:hypothetical protein